MNDRCKHDVRLTRVCVECEKLVYKLGCRGEPCLSPLGSIDGLYLCVNDKGHIEAHPFDHSYVRVKDGIEYIVKSEEEK